MTDDNGWQRSFEGQDMNDPFVRACYDSVAKASPDLRKHLVDSLAKADGIDQRVRDWVSQFANLAKAIDDQGKNNAWYLRELFWIRLGGVILELPHYLGRLAASAADFLRNPVCTNAALALEAIGRIRTRLSDSEIIFIEWLRDRAAHVRTDSYEIRWKKGRAKDLKTIKLLGSNLTIGEIDGKVREVLEDHGSDAAAAANLVDRLKPDILALLNATIDMNKGPRRAKPKPTRRRKP
jgi:hypothetical protein